MKFFFLHRFAPKNLLISVPSVLGILGVFLSRLTKINIGFVFPNPPQIMWAVLVGLAISLIVALGARIFVQLRWVLDWVFEEFPEEVWALLLISGLVSLGEELFFRGFLQPHLGLLMTSLVFSIYHFRINVNSLVIVPATFLLGLIFGQAYLSTANIFAPMIIHFLVLFGLGVVYQTFFRKAC